MDVGDHTTARDGRLDERVELLVTADGELQMARRDALDLCGGFLFFCWALGLRGEWLRERAFARGRGLAAGGGAAFWVEKKARFSKCQPGGGAPTPDVTRLEILRGVARELEHLGGQVLCAGCWGRGGAGGGAPS